MDTSVNQRSTTSLPSPKPSDAMLALLIEDQFGERLLDEICIPQGLVMGACLPIAIAVAKGVSEVCLS